MLEFDLLAEAHFADFQLSNQTSWELESSFLLILKRDGIFANKFLKFQMYKFGVCQLRLLKASFPTVSAGRQKEPEILYLQRRRVPPPGSREEFNGVGESICIATIAVGENGLFRGFSVTCIS